MGLLGLFNKKSHTETIPNNLPEISDLPPIPESSDIPDDLAFDQNDNLSLSESSPLDDFASKDDLSIGEFSDDLSLPDDSFPDPSKDIVEEPEFSQAEDSFDENPSPIIESSPDMETPNEPTLPVFDNANIASGMSIDSLSVPEIFVKKEHYAQVLEMLYSTKQELAELVKKSSLAKPNEKIGVLLSKAATKHAALNKGLMSVEEKLVN